MHLVPEKEIIYQQSDGDPLVKCSNLRWAGVIASSAILPTICWNDGRRPGSLHRHPESGNFSHIIL